MKRRLLINIVGLLAAALAWAGCQSDVRPLEADGGNSNDAPVMEAATPPTDTPRVCVNTCRPGFEHRQTDCECVSRCMPGCSPVQTCVVDARTGIWDCIMNSDMPDAGSSPDVMQPPADNGPSCTAGQACACDPGFTGVTVCGSNPGCRCTAIIPDAGTDVPPADSGPAPCNVGETRCSVGGACINTQTDTAHCGRCGNACPSGQVCAAGACVISCPTGTTNCSGACVDLVTSASHCGACGAACNLANASASCVASRCMVSSCRAGFADADGNAANGCEANLSTDSANCGSVGNVCRFSNAAAICISGTCRMDSCNNGFADCNGISADGCEINLQNDAMHCGACPTDCGLNSRCSAGACVVSCPAGQSNCSGACVDTRSTVAHCGACGRACAPSANASITCSAGACSYTCLANFVAPDGNPANGCTINLMTDRANCGSRGNACPSSAANGSVSCVSGVCRVACTGANFLDVDGQVANGCEVDVRSNMNHCGRQGNVCTVGQTCCGGVCTNLDRDQYNCGACGNSCSSGGACVSGYCTGTCRPTEQICRIDGRSSCSDLQSDANNCGACGTVCSATNAYSSCSTGACGLLACYSGYGNCDGSMVNGCETNLYASATHCGRCGNTCPSGPNSVPNCSYFGCGLTCSAGFADCDRVATTGCEANLNTSPTHCGWCGNTCRSGETCDAGRCVPNCTNPRVACGSTCVDQRNDPNHCGGCFNTCATGLNMDTACVSRTCRYTCNAGFDDCDRDITTGCETSITSVTNCGACGNRCSTGQSCLSGSCTCPSGQSVCSGACVNTQTDPNNCGACGRVCATGQTCSAGACTGSMPIDAGTTPDSGTPDASNDAGVDVADVRTDVVPTDSAVIPVSCPAGTHPRSITYRLPTAIPADCGAGTTTARPVFWGQSVADRTRIQVADDVSVTMVGSPATTPEFSVPFPVTGSSALRFLNTAFWPRGVVFYMSGRCGNRTQTYYEGFAYWSSVTTLASLPGGSFVVDGVERAGDVVSDGRVLYYVMEEPCIPD